MGTNLLLLLWTMPGLLNPLRDVKSEAFKYFRDVLCMKVPFDEVRNLHDLVSKSPLDGYDVLKVCEIMVFFEVSVEYVLHFFSLRKDVDSNYAIVVRDCYDILDVEQVMVIHGL